MMKSISSDDFSLTRNGDYVAWFDNEMPLSKLPFWSTLLASCFGCVIGTICSLIVNCALVEVSTSPFFTLYFAFTFIVIGIVILWRLNISTAEVDGKQRQFLRYFGLMSWFTHFPFVLKVAIYTLLGISISFALTFTIVDLVNYFISMFETSVARPLVESKSQVLVILVIACTMGAVFGFMFGFMKVEDEAEYHIKLALAKEESYTWPVGAVLGTLAGFCNNYLRHQEFWRFNRDNAYNVEI
ncbi:membrane protein, putative [Babesia bigemina]|uniref:Membrane protein, putative n=1 Tax=Babesia bigemina TaxID=5866 RepID=A0A061DDW6_BABBI|nr:membrane protein, putative [Babesia bigemina]CDR97749.1 membrane protein, putative [Babesia bigemina]|eukprot:XP_012769935.1 membrane protein, putative [Babesia bigemina]